MNFHSPDYIRAVVADREREIRNIQLINEARRSRRDVQQANSVRRTRLWSRRSPRAFDFPRRATVVE